MIARADKHDASAGPGFGHLLFCVVLGAVFFYLVGHAEAQVAAIALPDALLALWSRAPLAGGLIVNAITALAAYWVLAAAVGFAIAAAVRHDYIFYGAVATGVFIMLRAATDFDGWQAFVEVGPDFYLALRLDALRNDPFGTFSRWFALPICAWLWGRWLFSGTESDHEHE